jgi:Ca-activated chloride channel homolog
MTFERAWVLFFLLAPLLWAAVEWRSTTRRVALALKVASLIAIIVALSGPATAFLRSRMAVSVLLDTSASVSDADLNHAGEFAAEIRRVRGRNMVRVFPFARAVAAALPSGAAELRRIAGEDGSATDLESAVRHAIAATPVGMVPRIVLVSDGRENSGTVVRAAWQARELRIPVDTVGLDGRSQPAVHLKTITMPAFAFTGERFPIDLTLLSPSHVNATLAISADGRPLGSTPVALEGGDNSVHAHASISEAGSFDLSGSIRTAGGENIGDLRFDSAITLRRPKLLYVSHDPPGTEVNLLNALTAAQFDVLRTSVFPRGGVSDNQIVILNNEDLDAMPAEIKSQLEVFVRQGGGLLVIAGEKNVYREEIGPEDLLQKALPAQVAPPRSPEGTCVVLIIDKSSSMEGRKIELARLAASGVIDNLRPVDRVGVLIFDNSFQWAVPLRPAEDKVLIKQLVAGIAPDGGTQIAPALAEAFKRILPVHAAYKHVVLLTDGISEEGDSLDLAREADSEHVTISTVGLGQDVNRAYLEKVAQLAGGQSYFLSDPAGLEQILLRDVQQHTGSSAVEKTLRATVSRTAEILDGVGVESAPSLNGYVRFKARPGAETILKIDNDRDPLLVRWQYGLGRAAVFTSDAKSRWSERWIGWKGFDRFWINVARDLLPHAETGEAKASFDSASGDLIVEYHLSPAADPSGSVPPAIFAFGPGGFQQPVSLTRVTEGFWRGRVAVGKRTGLFRVRPMVESRAFPEIGFYREEREMHEYGANPFLLRQVSDFTGGRFNPEASQVFDPAGRSAPITMQLWPGLLGLAIVLNLAELILRKGRNLLPSNR